MDRTSKQVIADNIALLLKERGMFKVEVATKAGVSNSVLSDVTNAKGNPGIETLDKIAAALNVPLHRLTSPDMEEPIPSGCVRIVACVTKFQAHQIKLWDRAARSAKTGKR